MSGGVADDRVRSTAPAPAAGRWRRGVWLTVVFGIGACEAIVMTPGVSWDWAPSWLSMPIAMIGFLAFLLLVGLTSLVGNAAVGTLLLAYLWRGRGWPFWQAALFAAPYWIAFYRIIPKPW